LAAVLSAALSGAADIGEVSVVAELDLPVDLVDPEIPLGGLSGLAWDPACRILYAVSDDRGQFAPPRVHLLGVDLAPVDVRSLGVLTLRDEQGEPFGNEMLDAEAIALAPDGTLWLSTEGISHRGIPPRILGFRLDGALVDEIPVPQAYLPGERTGVRSNLGFEGLSITPDGRRLIAAVEAPLVQDGPPSDVDRGCLTRFLVVDLASRRLRVERAYPVEPVPDAPRPPTAFRINGVSEILALDADRVLVVERSFSAGVGNTIRIFLTDLRTGDAVTGRGSLPADVRPMRKTQIVDVADLGIAADNIEGLSFGPVLPDGRPSLVLVADNNFQPAVQRNQVLVLAVDGITAPARDRAPATIAEIQGADQVSPLVGRCVTDVQGTVTAILGRRSGQAFWVQQVPGDGDPATSDGLLVTALDGLGRVEVGDRVRFTGRVEEPVWRMELPVTRVVADGLEVTGGTSALPAPVVMGRGGRAIPAPNIDDDGLTRFEPDHDAIDYYESLEGMLVRVEDPVVVGPTSRHGEIVVLGDGGVGAAPRSARGGVVRTADTAHPERIVIDDRLVSGAPAVAVGDRLIGPVDGVLHASYGSYKLLNAQPLEVDRRAAVEPPSTSLVADEHHVTMATFNVENLNAGSGEAKLAAVAGVIVDRLAEPTVLAVQEIQDDSGPQDDGAVSAELTLDRLVDAIVAAGGPRYQWLQVDPGNNADGGRPGANIRVALLFDPARVTLPGDGGRLLPASPMRIGVGDPAFTDSRKPLAVELEVSGEPIVVVVCHLRSKGGDDPLFGRRQPPIRWSEEQRVPQAERVRGLIAPLLDADPGARIAVLGDLNDFEFSSAVHTIAAPPMVNLMERLPTAARSTYVYLGNSQTLDHIIVSAALADGAEIEVLHVNADLPASERASDHDPVLARFEIP
jgi:predicted extracellular nuclease